MWKSTMTRTDVPKDYVPLNHWKTDQRLNLSAIKKFGTHFGTIRLTTKSTCNSCKLWLTVSIIMRRYPKGVD